MSKLSILNPDAEAKLACGQTVTVRHLKWKDALKFFAMLREKAGAFIDDKGNLSATPAKIMEALNEFPELAEWLVKSTTDVAIDDLTLPDMSKLVFKALELNLGSIASEIKNFRGRLTALTAGEPTTKSNATLPSSAK